MHPWLAKLWGSLQIERGEVPRVAWSFTYYFSLLCAYYVLRPVRDEMGIQGGVENLQWVFTATFVAMLCAVPLFGYAVARYPRRQLIPRVYLFFIVNLLVFLVLFLGDVAPAWVARAFFVWLSVFNLFVVSVFWSLMADVFSNAEARRLFGVIAAGGSAGAILGPTLTVGLSEPLGTPGLLLVSIAFLGLSLVCVRALVRGRHGSRTGNAGDDAPAEAAVGGGIWNGAVHVMRSRYLLGICLFMVLYTTLSTFLYFMQAHIVEGAFADSAQRTRVFATIDLAVNVLTVGGQLFVVSRLMRYWGVAVTLALVPLFLVTGFAALGLYPTLAVLVAVQVLRRAGNYAITRPTREVLYTVIQREDKYKSKNFIDTVVYRGGDAVAGWIYAGFSLLGLGVAAIAFVAVPIAGLWAVDGFLLGRWQERLRRERQAAAVETK